MTDSSKTAIVTGGSKGIGAAIAARLAADGANVIVNYGHDAETAERTTEAITEAGGTARAVQADIADTAGIKTLFDAAENAFGGVDILVNNAGMMALSPIAEVDNDAFERQIALNLGGVFRGMREASNRLRENGRIISFSSSVVGLYQPGYGVYAGAKGAIEAMTHVLAKEVAARGITVNAVAPGPVATDLFLNGKSDELVESIEKMNPFGRLGEPEDIARLVAFLVGPDGGWVSGQVIRANGGVI